MDLLQQISNVYFSKVRSLYLNKNFPVKRTAGWLLIHSFKPRQECVPFWTKKWLN